MSTEAELRAEKHGKETGEIIANIKNLEKNVMSGFTRGEKRFDKIDKRFDDLEKTKCVPNTLKINEMHTWYSDYKEVKKTIFKTSLKIILPMFGILGGLFSAAFAYFQKT